MPGAKTSLVSARHTGETVVPKVAGVASLMREMSLLMLLGFQYGWVKTYTGVSVEGVHVFLQMFINDNFIFRNMQFIKGY